MGSRSNNMEADVGRRSSHAKEHSHSKTSWIRKYFRLALNSGEVYRESISRETTGNEDMCNVEQRAKSSGINSSTARTVRRSSDSLCNSTVNWWIGKDESCSRPRGDNEIVYFFCNDQSKCGKTGCMVRKNSQHLVKTRNRVRIQRRGTNAERSC